MDATRSLARMTLLPFLQCRSAVTRDDDARASAVARSVKREVLLVGIVPQNLNKCE